MEYLVILNSYEITPARTYAPECVRMRATVLQCVRNEAADSRMSRRYDPTQQTPRGKVLAALGPLTPTLSPRKCGERETGIDGLPKDDVSDGP